MRHRAISKSNSFQDVKAISVHMSRMVPELLSIAVFRVDIYRVITNILKWSCEGNNWPPLRSSSFVELGVWNCALLLHSATVTSSSISTVPNFCRWEHQLRNFQYLWIFFSGIELPGLLLNTNLVTPIKQNDDYVCSLCHAFSVGSVFPFGEYYTTFTIILFH